MGGDSGSPDVPFPGATARQFWATTNTFSLANPKGVEQGDVSRLLRTLAQYLSDLGAIDVLDVTFGTEINEYGTWPSFNVYFEFVADNE